MKRIILAVLLFGCGSNAQISAVLKRLPAGSPEVVVRNTSNVNLTAFAVSMATVAQESADRAPFIFFTDAAVATDRVGLAYPLPLPSTQEYPVPVPARHQAGHVVDVFEPPIVTAAVFEDGSTAGDPTLLSRLISRRGNMLQAVELAREILSDAGRHNVPRNLLVERFKTLAESVNHWYLPPEQQVGRALYQSIAGKLMNLPASAPGSAFPPAVFVEEETAALNRERISLMESRPGLQAIATRR